MELLTYSIPKSTKTFVLSPIGDIQWSGHNGPTAKDTLKRHIDRALSMDAYFVGMGDYTDFLSPSNRQKLKSAGLYETAEAVLEEKAVELMNEVFEEFLKPTVGRWLGLVEGHHLYQGPGWTTDEKLAGLLKTQFLGTSAYIKIPVADLVIYVHHGVGAGSLPGVGLNKLYHIQGTLQGADVYLMGHNCLPDRAKILTRSGFKHHSELLIGEDVLGYSMDSRTCQWTPARDITNFPQAPLYRISSKSFTAEATEEHSWVIRDWNGQESLKPFHELKSNHDIVVAAPAPGGTSDMSERLASVIGWIVTDGSIYTPKNGSQPEMCIGQKNEPHKTELREMLAGDATENPHKHHPGMSYFYLRAPFVRELMKYGFRKKSDILRLIPELSVGARYSLLKAFLDAEGDGVCTFTQREGPVMDAFMMLCALMGLRCGPLIPATDGSPHMINGRLAVCNGLTFKKKILRKRKGPVGVGYLKREDVDSGPVWCPTTDFGTWVAELDGHVFITGNTKLAAAPMGRTFPTWGKKRIQHALNHRNVHLVNTGGFSKSMIVGSAEGTILRGGYAERGMMVPSPLRAPFIIAYLETIKQHFNESVWVQV